MQEPLSDLPEETELSISKALHYPGCLKGLIAPSEGYDLDDEDLEIRSMWDPELGIK
jgi:hypothetical protein